MSRRERELLFEQLATRHIDLVFYVARSWCEDADEAEELVQEAFLRAFRKFASFQSGSNFKAWILKIMRNAYIDSLRRQKRRPLTVSTEEIGAQWADDKSEVWQTIDLENKEIFYDLFSDEIMLLLQELPKDTQLCLLLCDVEGLCYQEIAEVLSCPVGTVRSRIHRGRALFQKKIGAYAQKIGYLKGDKS